MAFTAEQKTLSYELLGLFQGGTFDWYDYNNWVTGVITSVPVHEQIDFSTATTRLEAIFTAIEAGSDGRETRIGEILTQYDKVSLNVARVTTGGAAGAAGTRYDPEEERFHLRKLLQTHLGIRVRVLQQDGNRRSVNLRR